MNYDTWIKLVTFELAALYNRPNDYATKRIATFEENPDITKLKDLFQNADDKEITPSDVANDILAYFKVEDDRKQAEKDAARKKSQANMTARHKRIINSIKMNHQSRSRNNLWSSN